MSMRLVIFGAKISMPLIKAVAIATATVVTTAVGSFAAGRKSK